MDPGARAAGQEERQCKRCYKWFSDQYSFAGHIYFDGGSKHFPCRECALMGPFLTATDRPLVDYRSAKKLKNHMVKEHNLCTHCAKLFESPGQLAAHRAQFLRGGYPCYLCQTWFPSPSSVFQHFESNRCTADREDMKYVVSKYAPYLGQYTSDNPFPGYFSRTYENVAIIQCRCIQTFRSYGGLMMHLESNACMEPLFEEAHTIPDTLIPAHLRGCTVTDPLPGT